MMSAGTRSLLNVVLATALVLLVGGVLTLLAASKAGRVDSALSEGRFRASTEQRLARIAERLRLPRYGLNGLRSVVEAR